MTRALLISSSKLEGENLTLVFRQMLVAYGIPDPAVEYRFARPVRQWRFDFSWPREKVALEVEGGAWTRGRHTRGKGFIEDMEKYNRATLLGWRVLRVTPQQLATHETATLLTQILRERR